MNIPKNIRQVGTPADSPKIFAEDYVITYLHQYAKEKMPDPCGAVLLGNSEREGDTMYLFVRSAYALEELTDERGKPAFTDRLWIDIYEKQELLFPGQKILGWFFSAPERSLGLSDTVQEIHRRHFSGKNMLLYMDDPTEGEEDFFLLENGRLARQGGFFIFYEKNDPMQQYMLEQKGGKSVDEGVIFTDRAARSFRAITRERQEQAHQKKVMSWLYAASSVLLLVVLAIGVTMLNNYEKMEDVQIALQDLAENMEGNRGKSPEDGKTQEAAGFAEAEVEEITPEEPMDEPEGQTGEPEEQIDEPEEPQPEPGEEAQTEPEAQPAEAEEPLFYIVKKGDTLLSIAEYFYDDPRYIETICELNGIEDCNHILIGEKILLP